MSERINLPAHGDRADLVGEFGKATRGHVVKEGAVGRKRCESGRGDWVHCRCSPRIPALSTIITANRSVVKPRRGIYAADPAIEFLSITVEPPARAHGPSPQV